VSIKHSKLASIAALLALTCYNAESACADHNVTNADLSSQTLAIQDPDEWWLRVYGDAFCIGFTDGADLAPSRTFTDSVKQPLVKRNRKSRSHQRLSQFRVFAVDFWKSKADRNRLISAFKTGYADGYRRSKSVCAMSGTGLSVIDGSLLEAKARSSKEALLKQGQRLGIPQSRTTHLVQVVWDDIHRPHSKLIEPELPDIQAQNDI